MSTESPVGPGHIVRWLIHRNPTYLVSACLVAAGSRLFLVNPAGAAGDIKFILITFAVLQLYEWAVGGILLAIHRAKKSPEDAPSLLLVATVFWTGPMAATIEMTTVRPHIGMLLAGGACLIATAELLTCCKTLRLQLSTTVQAIGCACFLLLAAAAPLLNIPASNSGRNEISLYITWWALACIVLTYLFELVRPQSAARSQVPWRQEATFLVLTVAATCTHLIGMNYAFFCHAERFYASPLIAAVAIVGFAAVSPALRWYKPLLALLAILPAGAILLALHPFNAEFPVQRLPVLLREPLISVSVIAGVAWFVGYWIHKTGMLLHAGCAAMVLAFLRIAQGPGVSLESTDRYTILEVLYGTAAYLAVMACFLRSRTDALLSIIANLVATIFLVRGTTRADSLVIFIVVCWSALIATHVVTHRPPLAWRIIPILALAIGPWMYNAASEFQTFIAGHAAGMCMLLLAIGQIWHWTRYRTVSTLLMLSHVLAYAVDWSRKSANPPAAILIFTGFCALALGAFISWHKVRILGSIPVETKNMHEASANTVTSDSAI